MNADEWKSKGRLIEVNGFKHFVVDSNNNKPPLMVLHGYPTCTYDYHKVLPILEKYFRVVLHDHLGFGYSDKPRDYSYSLMEQTDQALMLWQQLGLTEGVLLAHDYGTSIATEILARRVRFSKIPISLSDLVLCNGSMHVEMAQLRLIQRLLMNQTIGPWVAKLSSRRTLANNLRNIYSDAANITAEEIDALWLMMTHNKGRQVLSKITGYIKQRYTYWHRWIGALKTTDTPVHIIWAKDDPVAVPEMALILESETLNSRLTMLTDLGHFPMLEGPEKWSEAVIESLLQGE